MNILGPKGTAKTKRARRGMEKAWNEADEPLRAWLAPWHKGRSFRRRRYDALKNVHLETDL